PVYEYQCKACGRDFDYQQRMSDPDKTVCEACGGELERLISRTAFALKGSGWYKDLYSSSKPEAKPAESGGETKTETKSADSKPADSKSADGKPADSKPADSKPAETKSTKSTDGGSSSGSGGSSSGSGGSGAS